jgi:hypothetical protein
MRPSTSAPATVTRTDRRGDALVRRTMRGYGSGFVLDVKPRMPLHGIPVVCGLSREPLIHGSAAARPGVIVVNDEDAPSRKVGAESFQATSDRFVPVSVDVR